MSPESRRGDRERLKDIVEAAAAIGEHLDAMAGDSTSERVFMDAIKYNLVAIGEAAGHISEELRQERPEIDWPAITGLRNILTHEYFKVNPDLIREIAESSVPELLNSAQILIAEV